MRLPIRLTLAVGLVLAVSSLIVGALVPLPAQPTANSPYLSVLSDLSVPSAEAVPCNTICDRQQGEWFCIPDLEVSALACHKFGNNQCENLSGLCG